jgi:hypothetical protein
MPLKLPLVEELFEELELSLLGRWAVTTAGSSSGIVAFPAAGNRHVVFFFRRCDLAPQDREQGRARRGPAKASVVSMWS